MKSKKLITLAIPVMLLGGCATTQGSPKMERTWSKNTYDGAGCRKSNSEIRGFRDY